MEEWEELLKKLNVERAWKDFNICKGKKIDSSRKIENKYRINCEYFEWKNIKYFPNI